MTIDATEQAGATTTNQTVLPESGANSSLPNHTPSPLDNVPLAVEVVLGRTTMLFRELRDLQIGNPIELDRSPHQPVDVLVNGSAFARGEIVVINDESLGVRITEILQHSEARP